jgi:hypothetical protein
MVASYQGYDCLQVVSPFALDIKSQGEGWQRKTLFSWRTDEHKEI